MNPIILRLAVIAVALVLWFWTQKLIAGKSGATGIHDGVHRLTSSWHGYFSRNRKATDRALIVSSFFIDVLGFSMIALSVFGSTFAPFLGLLIVFSLRQVSQFCCTLPPPPGMIWHHPGFPSALVTYGVSNDLFFSGHTALAALAAIEICQIAPWWLAGIVLAIAAGEALIVLILRAHYTMDVVAAVFAAWFAADLAGRLAPGIDACLR